MPNEDRPSFIGWDTIGPYRLLDVPRGVDMAIGQWVTE